tara:strand:+ start:300 stop:815 length:516 start_codon:yes stop_codon:yes gene_type:complete
MTKKKKKSYKTYEEGSLMDAYVKQVQKHGASSLLMPDKETHDYLKRKGFFSPKGTLPKKKVKPSGMKGKAKVMKEGGKVGLYANMNKRKRAGTSRSKSDTTISKKNYDNMKKGFPKAKHGGKVKELKKISKELKGASKMHLGQSKRIAKHVKKMAGDSVKSYSHGGYVEGE